MIRKTKKSKQLYLLISLAALLVGVVFSFGFNKSLAFPQGWGAGIWNNYVVGHSEHDPSIPPTIGWLKSSSDINGPCLLGEGYSIVFSSGNPGDSERYVSGKAWFGIGSQSDSDGSCQDDLPSLGWLNFEAGAPPFCSGDDCHAARWYKTGSDDYTGYLDGWAQVTSMGDNGWVRLRDPNPDPKKYSVSVDASGVLSGYSWNSGPESTISGNSGLGWIKMDGLKIEECNLGCATKLLCGTDTFSSCDATFCSGSGASCTLGADEKSWTCSNGCGSVPCEPNIIDPEIGVCGLLGGKSICGYSGTPSDDDLCANGTTPHNFTKGVYTATWTCGSDECGGEEVSCSASARCGWIETNP